MFRDNRRPSNVKLASSIEDASKSATQITFDDAPHPAHKPKALYIPSPREREEGQKYQVVDTLHSAQCCTGQDIHELDDDYSNGGKVVGNVEMFTNLQQIMTRF
jgi:hypothetical protein